MRPCDSELPTHRARAALGTDPGRYSPPTALALRTCRCPTRAQFESFFDWYSSSRAAYEALFEAVPQTLLQAYVIVYIFAFNPSDPLMDELNTLEILFSLVLSAREVYGTLIAPALKMGMDPVSYLKALSSCAAAGNARLPPQPSPPHSACAAACRAAPACVPARLSAPAPALLSSRRARRERALSHARAALTAAVSAAAAASHAPLAARPFAPQRHPQARGL